MRDEQTPMFLWICRSSFVHLLHPLRTISLLFPTLSLISPGSVVPMMKSSWEWPRRPPQAGRRWAKAEAAGSSQLLLEGLSSVYGQSECVWLQSSAESRDASSTSDSVIFSQQPALVVCKMKRTGKSLRRYGLNRAVAWVEDPDAEPGQCYLIVQASL